MKDLKLTFYTPKEASFAGMKEKYPHFLVCFRVWGTLHFGMSIHYLWASPARRII